MSESTIPAINNRTEQLAVMRDEAVQKFEMGMKLIAEASALAGCSLFDYKIMKPNGFGLPESLPESVETGRKLIDLKFWQRIFAETGLERFWNHRQRTDFHQQLRDDPPYFSLLVLRSTLRDAVQRRQETLSEGFIDLLTGLDKSFKRNIVRYTLPQKLVLRGVFDALPQRGWNGYHPNNESTIRDLENIICVCTGSPTPGRMTDMADRLKQLRQEEGSGDVINEQGWCCRLFANGNVHILFEDTSMIAALNNLIAIYFSGQLPAKGHQHNEK